MQYLHLGNTLQFARTDQIILQANVAAELLAVMVHSRKVLGLSYNLEMEYPDRIISYFSSFPQDKRRHSTFN